MTQVITSDHHTGISMNSVLNISGGSPHKLIFRVVSNWPSPIPRNVVANTCNSEAKVQLFDTTKAYWTGMLV